MSTSIDNPPHSGRGSRSPPIPDFNATAVMETEKGSSLLNSDGRSSEESKGEDSSKQSESQEPSLDRGKDFAFSPPMLPHQKTATPSLEQTASETLEPCCADVRETLDEEYVQRETADNRVEVRDREIVELCEKEKDEGRESKIVEATVALEEVTELRMEVAKLKKLLEERDREIAQKDERIRLLQEKLVDQLLGDSNPAKTKRKTTAKSSLSSSFTRDASPRSSAIRTRPTPNSGSLSRGSRGQSPAAKDPLSVSARRAPLVAGSATASSERRPLFSWNRDAPTPTRKTNTPAKPTPLLSGSALSSARKQVWTPKPSGTLSTASNPSPLRSSVQRPARVAPVRPPLVGRRAVTPQRSHPGAVTHPGLLSSAAAPSRESPFSRSTPAASPLHRGMRSTSVSSAQPMRQAITPLHSTTPTRSVYSGETTTSRRRPRISCSVGRNEETLLKGTTTTVTFKCRGSTGAHSMGASREILAADLMELPESLLPLKDTRAPTLVPFSNEVQPQDPVSGVLPR